MPRRKTQSQLQLQQLIESNRELTQAMLLQAQSIHALAAAVAELSEGMTEVDQDDSVAGVMS